MTFDLNLGKEPDMPIEGWFTIENTNDMGEPLVPQAAQVIIAEFKKFIYLCIIKILRNKWSGKLDMNQVPKLGDVPCYLAPYSAPPYLDRVWRCFLLHRWQYHVFCCQMVGGIIERTEMRENIQAAYIKYSNVWSEAFKRQSYMHPFKSLWSEYKSADEMEADAKYTSFLNNDTLPALV